MSKANAGGCAGGILHLFGAIGVVVLGMARLGDNALGCARSASKFDNIGTGTRLFDGANESQGIRHLTDAEMEAIFSRQQLHKKANPAVSSAHLTDDAVDALDESTVLRKEDYVYRPMNGWDAAREASRLASDVQRQQRIARQDSVMINSFYQKEQHALLIQEFVAAYREYNPFFTPEQKEWIGRAAFYTDWRVFPAFKQLLLTIDENLIRLHESAALGEKAGKAYRREVINNLKVYLNMETTLHTNFDALAKVSKESGYAIFIGLLPSGKEKTALVQRTLR